MKAKLKKCIKRNLVIKHKKVDTLRSSAIVSVGRCLFVPDGDQIILQYGHILCLLNQCHGHGRTGHRVEKHSGPAAKAVGFRLRTGPQFVHASFD